MLLKSHLPLRPPTWRSAILLPLAFTAAAWAAWLVLGPLLEREAPYLFFIGAVLASVYWGGRLGGLIAAFTGGLLANATSLAGGRAAFIPPSASELAGLAVFWAFCAGLVWVVETLINAIREEVRQKEQLALVRGELQHRIRNMLAVTESIARQTGRSACSIDDFQDRLASRLHALGLAQDLLSNPTGGPVLVDGVISRALAPFMADGRLTLEVCSAARIVADLVTPLALVLNELATNAAKYGALSAAQGRVSLRCRARGEQIWIEWVEGGGPEVAAPTRSGFGASLMRAAIPRSQGAVEVRYDPEGLRCDIRLKAYHPVMFGSPPPRRALNGRSRARSSPRLSAG